MGIFSARDSLPSCLVGNGDIQNTGLNKGQKGNLAKGKFGLFNVEIFFSFFMLGIKFFAGATDKAQVVGSLSFPRLSPLLYLFFHFYTDIRRKITIMTGWSRLNEMRCYSCTPHFGRQQFQIVDLLFSYQFIQLAVCTVDRQMSR